MFMEVVTGVVVIINIKIGVYLRKIKRLQNMQMLIINFTSIDAIVIFRI